MGIKLDVIFLCIFIACLFVDVHDAVHGIDTKIFLITVPWPFAIGLDVAFVLWLAIRVGIWWKEQTPEQIELIDHMELDDK